MKKVKKMIIIMLVIIMAGNVCSSSVQAASKKNIYVLTKVKYSSTDGYRYKKTIKYNKSGLVSSTAQNGSHGAASSWFNYKYQYDSKNRIKQVKSDMHYIHDAIDKYYYDNILIRK